MSSSSSAGLIVWRAYSGSSAVTLSLVLLAVGLGLIFQSGRLAGPLRLPRPGGALKVAIFAFWVLSILLVLPMFRRVAVETGQSALNIGPVFPITLASAFCTFFFVAYVTRAGGALAALANGLLGFVAGPMVFELPFVLIIAPVTTTHIDHPLFLFATFLVVILSTLILATFSSRFAVSRHSLFFLAAMFVVFALWVALTGYAPPSDPVSFSLNAISKVLGFAAVAASFTRSPSEP